MSARAIVLALALAQAGCVIGHLAERADLRVSPEVAKASPRRPVVLLPVQDLRPAGLRGAHPPAITGEMGLGVPGRLFGYVRREGVNLAGDENLDLRLEGFVRPGEPVAVLDELLARTLAAGLGERFSRAAGPVDLTNVALSAAAVPGGAGTVVLPLLDQLDLMRFESGEAAPAVLSAPVGEGSRFVTSATTNPEAGVQSPTYANVRLRLVLIAVRDGKAWVQGRGYVAQSKGTVASALDASAVAVSRRVGGFLDFFDGAR